MNNTVSSEQRFKRNGLSCPICGGYEQEHRGNGTRCYGYMHDSNEYATCTNDGYAGKLERKDSGYTHKLRGSCNCGTEHAPAPLPSPSSNGHKRTKVRAEQRRIIDTYNYEDEQRKLVFQTVRYDPKDFTQRRPDGNGGWIYNLHDTTRLLYRLPELVAAPPESIRLIIEGEKAVEVARRLGFIATTNVFGAGKWQESYNQYFKDRHVVILPDNDDKGKEHAAKVLKSLTGIARSIRIVELPGLPEKGDIVEWVTAGGTKEGLEQLVRLPKRKFTYASEVQEQPINWLWNQRLARGCFTLAIGDPGVGKGLTIMKIIRTITRGETLPGGPDIEPGGVILMSPEDPTSRVLIPRLKAAGAELSKVLLLNEVEEFIDPAHPEKGLYQRPVSFPEDTHILREAIEDAGASLVIIDPVLSLLSGKVDAHRNHAVRQAMAQVISTADKHNCAVLGVMHLNRSQNPNVLYRSSSSNAFIEMVRTAIYFAADPDGEPGKSGVVVNYKNNLTKFASSIRYTIHENENHIGYIRWNGESRHSRDDLLNQTLSNDNHKSEQQDELVTILKAHHEAMSAEEIKPEVKQTLAGLKMMLSRKVEEGVLMRTARGKYTYMGNPLYSQEINDVTNVTNVKSVTNVTNVASEPSQESNILTSDVTIESGNKAASDGQSGDSNISNITLNGKLPFLAPPPYMDGPKNALEARELLMQWVDTPHGFGQIVHTTADRVDVDVMGKIYSLRGGEIPQIRAKARVSA